MVKGISIQVSPILEMHPFCAPASSICTELALLIFTANSTENCLGALFPFFTFLVALHHSNLPSTPTADTALAKVINDIPVAKSTTDSSIFLEICTKSVLLFTHSLFQCLLFTTSQTQPGLIFFLCQRLDYSQTSVVLLFSLYKFPWANSTSRITSITI